MKNKKNVKKILVSSTSIISIGAILGTGIFVANINDQKSKSLVEDVALNENNAESKNATPSVFYGRILTKQDVIALNWDKQTTITLKDWKDWAPNVIQISAPGADPSTAPFTSYNLVSIEIPQQVTLISTYSFAGTRSLTSITFEENSQLKEIGYGAIYNNRDLTTIAIPDSVETIGKYAFGEGSFTEIKFNPTSKLKEISSHAFINNPKLKGIYIPDGVTSIGTKAFENTPALLGPNISMPTTLKTNSPSYGFTQAQWDNIAWRAVPFLGTVLTKKDVIDLNWDKKTTITLQDWKDWAPNVIQISARYTSIANSLFTGDSLVSIEIPQQVTLISDYSFVDARSLTSITFEENSQLKEIGYAAIYNNGRNLTTIAIPDSVEKIGSSAFGEGSFTEIKFNPTSKLKEIKNNTFINNTKLKGIYIPDGVTLIGGDAFKSTPALLGPNISMPIALKKGSSTALYGFTQAQWDTIAWRVAPFMGTVLTKQDVQNLLWDKKANITLQDWKDWAPNVIQISAPGTSGVDSPFAGSSLVSIEIPAKVKLISDRTFYKINSLTSITFEENSQLEEIGVAGIFENQKLTTITIPDSVEKIGYNAFNAGYFTTITINKTSRLTEIGSFAFGNCERLTSEIYIPDSVTLIGDHAFADTFSLLGSKVSMSIALKKGSSTALYGFTQAQWNSIAWRPVPFLGTVLTKQDVQDLLWDKKTTITLDDWKKWAPNVIKIGGLDADSDDMSRGPFYKNNILQSIVIPSKVILIGSNAFDTCSNLNSVTFESGSQLKSISKAAFYGVKITSFELPDSVLVIRNAAFQKNELLKTFTINEISKLNTIETKVFDGSLALTNIYIPNGVTSIGAIAFQNTAALLGSKVSMPIALKKGSSTALYGFTQAQWNTIAWRPVPFLGTVLTKQDVIDLNWDKKTTITLQDWKDWAPNVIQISTAAGIQSYDSPFSGPSLVSIEIPAKVKLILGYSFLRLDSLLSITFEENSQLKELGYAAFSQISKIKSIIIPDSVEKIGEYALSSSSFESIIISKTSKLKEIGRYGLGSNKKLKEIYIPDSVIKIEDFAFNGNTTLLGSKVSMPIALKKGSSTYGFTQAQWNTIAWRPVPFLGTVLTKQDVIDLNWDKKTTITLQDWKDWAPNVIQISKIKGNNFDPKERVFFNTPLVSIEIPAKVQIIGSYSFGSLGSLTSITFEANSQLKEMSYGAIQRTAIESITLPDSLEIIWNESLSRNSYLKNILISKESKLNKIGAYAFSNSPWLQEIYIPDGVTFIDISAFDSTNSLLGSRVSMPITLKKGSSDRLYGFTQAQWDTIAWRIPPFLGTVLTQKDVRALLWDKKANITLQDWIDWAPNVIQISAPGTSSANSPFAGSSLVSIEIPAKVKLISDWSFSLPSLTSITFEANSQLEEIGAFAIFQNENLKTIAIPDSVKKIGNSAFKDGFFTTITINKTSRLTEIGSNAFAFCDLVTSEIYIPDSVIKIGDSAFANTGFQGPKISMNISWYEKYGDVPQFGFTPKQWSSIAWRGVKEIKDLPTANLSQIIFSGTTHKLIINEPDRLYLSNVFRGNLTNAKKAINILYRTSASVPVSQGKTKDEFIAYLATLKGSALNDLDLSKFVASYSFTDSGRVDYKAENFYNNNFNPTQGKDQLLNMPDVVKSLDLSKYITDAGKITANGTPNSITWTNLLNIADLQALNVKVEWSYWTKNASGNIARSEWENAAPSKVAVINHNDGSNAYPIAIRFMPMDTSKKTDLLNGELNPVDTIKGYAVDVSQLSSSVNITDKWSTGQYKVNGFIANSNIIKTTLIFDDLGASTQSRENLILQLAVGDSAPAKSGGKITPRKLVIPWTNIKDFKQAIAEYTKSQDIAFEDLNIFARLVLKDGTGPDGNMIGDITYTWDRDIVNIYNNINGSNAQYTNGSIKLRSVTTIKSTWYESLSVEGLTMEKVKITSEGNALDINALNKQGVFLQVNLDEANVSGWEDVMRYSDKEYNVSLTKRLFFRLFVKDSNKFEIVGTPVNNVEGTETAIQPINAIGKELLNVKPGDLQTLIKLTGSTHKLIITEDPKVYTNSGLDLVTAKKNFIVEYTFNGTSWQGASKFIEALGKLSGNTLNNLDTSLFKARYSLTDLGKTTYFSPFAFGSANYDPSLGEKVLSTDLIIKTIDLNQYIKNVEKVILSGKTTEIIVNSDALNLEELKNLGVTIEWDYWTLSGSNYVRAGWVAEAPTSIGILKNPNEPNVLPIAIRFVTIKPLTELKDIVNSVASDQLKTGYLPNISALKEIIDLQTTVRHYGINGISGNIMSTLNTITIIDEKVSPMAKSLLELQFSMGENIDNPIIKWGNLEAFKLAVTKYNETKDILRPDLNIYMKLILKGGTGPDENELNDITYIWDKTPEKIYDSTNGVVADFNPDGVRGILRVYSRMKANWADSLTAEGRIASQVKIFDRDGLFDFDYYTKRGIYLEVSFNHGTSWKSVLQFNSEIFDASETGMVMYRLFIKSPATFEMYGVPEITDNGTVLVSKEEKVLAPLLIKNILATNLEKMIIFTGTTNKIVITEDPKLYEITGLLPEDQGRVREIITIKYSLNGETFFTQEDFKIYLNRLSKKTLNLLDFSQFKARYEFINKEQENYYSPEIWNSIDAIQKDTIKTISAESVKDLVRTIDLSDFIQGVDGVLLTGESKKIIANLDSLKLTDLNALGVKIEWNYWITDPSDKSKYIRAGWVDATPESVAILNNPADKNQFPIAIRFAKITPDDPKIELKYIAGGVATNPDSIKGYEVDTSNLIEVISFDETLKNNYKVSGIKTNIIIVANGIFVDTSTVSAIAKEKLELQFAIGASQEGPYIVDWSSELAFKKEIIKYNETKDILRPDLNIYMKLILKGGTGNDNNVIDDVKYVWDKEIVEIYNQANGVNSIYSSDFVESEKYLRVYIKIESTWSENLIAKGKKSTEVKVSSLNAEELKSFISYLNDRGTNLEVSPDDGITWTKILKFNDQSFDASVTNMMWYRLNVIDPMFYQLYSDNSGIIESGGNSTVIKKKEIDALNLLQGIKSESLVTDKIKVSGTTHDLKILEDETLYTVSGMDITTAKTFFEIKYNFNNNNTGYLNASDFAKYLYTLTGTTGLNDLSLSQFKIRYEFTELGLKKFYSPEVANDPEALSNSTKSLNTKDVVKVVDLHEYILNIGQIKVSGDTTELNYDMGSLDSNAMNALGYLGIKIEWDYWKNDPITGNYVRAGWVSEPPKSVAILNNPADTSPYSIAIRFTKIDPLNKDKMVDMISGTQLEPLNNVKGYAVDVSKVTVTIKYIETLGEQWLIKGINGNVITMNVGQDSEKVSKPALRDLEMQFGIGKSETNLLGVFANASDFRKNIVNYNRTNDILRSEMNIYARLILKKATNTDGDQIDGITYVWDKRVVQVYNNVTGVDAKFDKTDVAGSHLRAYSKIESTWSESLSAEGDESTSVKILSKLDKFDIEYYKERGIELQVSPDLGKTWTAITEIPSNQSFDASETNKMSFKLKVIDASIYQIYSQTADIVIEPAGEETNVIEKEIIAKIELKNILANSLVSDKIKVSGTTHDLKIVEDDTLYTDSGMDITTAKTFFEIKYSYDADEKNWFNVAAFIKKLNSLKNNELNNLELVNFKVRYEFTELGKKTFWSREVFGDIKPNPGIVKTLLTNDVVKTLDLNAYIANVRNVILSGDTTSIQYNTDALNIKELTRIGVKIQWEFWVLKDGKYVRSEWVDEAPATVVALNPNPENVGPGIDVNSVYPISIRFVKTVESNNSIELTSLVGGTPNPLDMIKGYEPNITNLAEVIVFDERIGTDWFVKGIVGNVFTMDIQADPMSTVSTPALSSLEMQFTIGISDSIGVIPWSNAADLKIAIVNYYKTEDILKSELNIFMRLSLIGGTGDNNDMIGKVKYKWDNRIVQIYNNLSGVNKDWDNVDERGSFLRSISKIQSNWANSLEAIGEESTKVGIESVDNIFNIQYYTDRGINFEVSPDAGKTWTVIKKLPSDKNLNASITNKMLYRLIVTNEKLYEIYSDVDNVVDPNNGVKTINVEKDVKAKTELVGILANNLNNDLLLKVKGTTHKLNVIEEDGLYEALGMPPSVIKTFVEIKYSIDGTKNSYMNIRDFTKMLNELRGIELNNLDLSSFKLRYEFTELGKTLYWSDQVFEGRVDGVSPDVIKTLNTTNIIKTIDVSTEILDISTVVKVTGSTKHITWNGTESLDAIKTYVKVEYGIYVPKVGELGVFEYQWSETRPTSITTKDKPEGQINYPIGIRFMPLDKDMNKVEIGSIINTNFIDADIQKGYEVDTSKLVTIIDIDTTKLGESIILTGPFNDLNSGQEQSAVELAAKELISPIFRDKIDLKYIISIFPGEELSFVQMKEKLLAYSKDFSNETSGLIFFNNGKINGVTITAKFVSNDPAYIVEATPSDSAILKTDKIKTSVDLTKYVEILKTVKVEPTGTSAADVGELILPPMTGSNVLFAGKTFLEIQNILSSVIEFQFQAKGTTNGDNWVPLREITSLNALNELSIRFVVKTDAITNVELSIEGINDWESFMEVGIPLKVNLPIQIPTNHKDLTDNIVLTGDTKNLSINDDKIYADLIALSPTYEGKVRIIYSIGNTPIALDGTNTEYEKDAFITALANYTSDIKLSEKDIKARYALTLNANDNPDFQYDILDKETAILNSDSILIYIHPSNYYEIAEKITVDGTSSKIIWSPELAELKKVLSEGLIIQYSNHTNPSLEAAVDSPDWTDVELKEIDPITKKLWIRFITKNGYVFGAVPKLVVINTEKVRSITEVRGEWLELIKLEGNTRDIIFNTTNFIKTMKDNRVAGFEEIVVQYNFGGSVPDSIVSASGDGWYNAEQMTQILSLLKGAKNEKELILFRNTLKARYTMSDEGNKKYILNIDGIEYLDQFALLSTPISLVTEVNNQDSFEGYINMDLFPGFNGDSFSITGTSSKPILTTKNEGLILALEYYQKETPFNIYYSNKIDDWTNKNQTIFDERGFKTSFIPGFTIKPDSAGVFQPIYFKFAARPGYGVWESDLKLNDGKIIAIKDIQIITEINNPIKDPVYLEFTGYQGEGSPIAFVREGGLEVTSDYLNPQYLETDPRPLRLEYNVNDYKYNEDEYKQVLESQDTEIWLRELPKTLKVNQYIIVRVAINNPLFQFDEKSSSQPTLPIRVSGLMIHADSLDVSPKLLLDNSSEYGYPPLDGKTIIGEANIISGDKYVNDFLGADLLLSVDADFYRAANGSVLIDSNGIPIIKRNPEGAIKTGIYLDNLGNPILENGTTEIPIYMKEENGISIPADPLRTGVWQTPQDMRNNSDGIFSQQNLGNPEWKLFQNQYVQFSFKPRVGMGTVEKPDFIFDTSIAAKPEIKLVDIKYPIQMNGILYRFDQIKDIDIPYVSDLGETPENPENLPYTGASHISKDFIVKAFRKEGISEETLLSGVEIEEKIKQDSNGLVKLQMTHSSPGTDSVVATGLDLSKFYSLKNGDTIKVEFVPTNDNFILANPFTPWIINIKGLNAKTPSDELFEYLRADFKGQINGGGSFSIKLGNPSIPSETNADILGKDVWYEYQVWNSDETLKTKWTKDENNLSNLKNGDKVEWKLINRAGALNPDNYNTLIFPRTEGQPVEFRVVNVIDGIEDTVRKGKGHSSVDNPEIGGEAQYPKNSGWIVSGLKSEIILEEEQKNLFEKAIKSFNPLFSGINGLGTMQSNINNNNPIAENVIIAWMTSKNDGTLEREITDFNKANLSNNDKVWVTIKSNNPDLILEQIQIISSKDNPVIVTGLTNPSNSLSQTVTIALATAASSILLIALIALTLVAAKRNKLDNNKGFKK